MPNFSDARPSNRMYRTREVARKTGIAYRTLLRFVEHECISPLKSVGSNEVETFYWTATDVYWATIGIQLLSYGFTLQRIKDVIHHLKEHCKEAFSHEDVFVEDDKFLMVDNSNEGFISVLDGCATLQSSDFLKRGKGCLLMRIEALEDFTQKLIFE